MGRRIAKKVLLVGWDAADWSLCEPLLAQGLMPNLKGLMERGASGRLASLMPMLSPVAWTSIATGKRPYKHGVLGMFEPDPEVGGVRPASSVSRTTKSIWNILTQQGLVTHVIGWRGAHPAEPINGINVTDQHAIARVEYGKPWPQPEGSYHPPDVGPTLASLRVHPHQLDRETLAFFVPQLDRITVAEVGRLNMLAKWLAAAVTNHAAATWAMEQQSWDFTAVCYGDLEHLSHAFLHYMAPRRDSLPESDFEMFQHVVPACYRFHDLMLGRLLELAGEDATVILVSDHGCKTAAMRPARIGGVPDDLEEWHRRSGVCVISGPTVKAGTRLTDAAILDVAPTVLTLLGLPVGEDMEGRPLLEIFDEILEPKRLASWDLVPGESGMHPPANQDAHDELLKLMDQLHEMGFRDPKEQQLAEKQARVVDRNRFNLARSMIEGGQLEQAVEVLEELSGAQPTSQAYVSMLLEAYLLSGRHTDAQQVVSELPMSLAGQPFVELALGRIDLADRRPAAAVQHFLAAEKADGRNLRVQIFLGQAYLDLRRWADARHAFQKALDLEAGHAEALYGLCVVSLREGDSNTAVKFAAAAVESNPALSGAHYYLGLALLKTGRHEEAAAALERAVDFNPTIRGARRRLVRLYNDELGDPARARPHAEWLDGLRRERHGERAAQAPPS